MSIQDCIFCGEKLIPEVTKAGSIYFISSTRSGDNNHNKDCNNYCSIVDSNWYVIVSEEDNYMLMQDRYLICDLEFEGPFKLPESAEQFNKICNRYKKLAKFA